MMKNLGVSSADGIQGADDAIVFLSKSYQSGEQTDLHVHPRAQFLYATSGSMTAGTAYGSWIVPTGYGLIIPGGIEHQVEMYGEVCLKSVYILPEKLTHAKRSQCSVIRVSNLLSACIDRFSELSRGTIKNGIVGHLEAVIISEINEAPPATMVLPFPSSNKLMGVAKFLLENPACPKAIDHWAYDLGMSRRSFTRAFKAETGVSFGQWRQRMRFQKATELLAGGRHPSLVAAIVGFKSTAVFRAMMKRFL